MTDDDRKRLATAAVKGMRSRCDKPVRIGFGQARFAEDNLCGGELKMTGLFQPGATAPSIVIRCSLCDTYNPEDEA